MRIFQGKYYIDGSTHFHHYAELHQVKQKTKPFILYI